MTSEAWTPGPWTAKREGGVWYVDPVGSQNESVIRLERADQAEANAALIAAAPIMAEVLDAPEWSEIDDAITEWTDGKTSDLAALGRVARRFFALNDKRRAALALARGEKS